VLCYNNIKLLRVMETRKEKKRRGRLISTKASDHGEGHAGGETCRKAAMPLRVESCWMRSRIKEGLLSLIMCTKFRYFVLASTR